MPRPYSCITHSARADRSFTSFRHDIFIDRKRLFLRREMANPSGRLGRENGARTGVNKRKKQRLQCHPDNSLFPFPVSHLMNALGLSIFRREKRLFSSLYLRPLLRMSLGFLTTNFQFSPYGSTESVVSKKEFYFLLPCIFFVYKEFYCKNNLGFIFEEIV